jgi:hypothetical protein
MSRGGLLAFEALFSWGVEDGGGESERVIDQFRQHPDGELAAAAEGAKESAFGCDALARGQVIEQMSESEGFEIVGTTLEAESPLADGGEEPGCVNNLGDRVGQAETLEASLCQDQSVQVLLGQFPQTGFNVATDWNQVQVGAAMADLGLAARAAGGDRTVQRNTLERGVTMRNEGVGDRSALGDGGQDEALDGPSRQILQAVDGKIDPAVEKSTLDFPGEKSFAAHLGQRFVTDLVARGLDLDEQDGPGACQRFEPFGYVSRLPERQSAAASADAERRCHEG